ncbi:MAG: flagellar motor protein MotB [Betaproteobacteria bacterium]|nr:flagellar motor protein MotB [Betaproteobacteria bacterium]
MANGEQQQIIVKRIKKSGGGHHGGAWKIAYADFVTAMMAFFLLMWLLGSTAKGDLAGIADYFATPLKVALQGGSGSGDASSVIKGGGTDLTRSEGQRKKGDIEAEKKTINLKAAEAERARQERNRLLELKARLDAAIDANAALQPFKNQLRVDLTPDGLRIQIVDELNRAMFDSGSALLKDYTKNILRELGRLMNDVPNKISLSGHTDAKPYSSGERGYSNWELSADRANASRRELIAGGIAENKMIRVIGQGPAVALDKSDVYNPINRRISITVLNGEAERRILEDSVNPALEIPADGSAPAALPADGVPASVPVPAAPVAPGR